MTLNYRTLTTITAVALGLALGWGLGTQPIRAQAPAPAKQNWKDQKEFDLYTAFTKATGKGKVEALDKWKQEYPTSDFAFDREEAYLGTYQELGMIRQAFDKAESTAAVQPASGTGRKRNWELRTASDGGTSRGCSVARGREARREAADNSFREQRQSGGERGGAP